MTRSPAVGKLVAGLCLASTRAAPLVVVGSSTSAGYLLPNSEDRVWTKFIRMCQQRRPSPTMWESVVQYSDSATFTRIADPGVHGYSAGQAGLTSANYLTADEIARISALAPVGVIHLGVGSNDLVQGVSPATYRSNVLAKLDRFNIPSLCGHVYVHQHGRTGTFAYPWEAYRDVWLGIEQERPLQVGVIDLAPTFLGLGIPGTDRRNLLKDDDTHLEVDGQTVLATLMFDEIVG